MSARHTTRLADEKTTDHTEAYARLKATEGVHGKSVQRARTEPMSFATPSQDLVIVANERHDNPEEHTYAVVVDDGLPVHCTCPAEKRFPTPCKHRLACALNEAVLAGAEEREEAENEPVPIADGGQVTVEEHAPGCDDPACEGLNADTRRPELSFPCWEVWAAENHDWSEEVAARETAPTPSRADVNDIMLERALVEEVSRR